MRIGFVFISLLFVSACGVAADEEAAAEYAEAMEAEASAEAIYIPEFTLPAPKPSVRANIAISQFDNPQQIRDIANPLSDALIEAGYEDLGYYEAPGGFAVVTETERIYEDGRPYDGSERFQFQANALISVSDIFDDFPAGILARLQNADPGRYRVIVFLVTTEAVTSSSAEADFGTVEGWTDDGADFLPSFIGNQPLGEDLNMSVLIYEFRRQSVGSEVSVSERSVAATQHLAATGIALGGGQP